MADWNFDWTIVALDNSLERASERLLFQRTKFRVRALGVDQHHHDPDFDRCSLLRPRNALMEHRTGVEVIRTPSRNICLQG